MILEPYCELGVLANIIGRFGLDALRPSLRACESMAADDAPLDVAVLGQFKCGKSSLLNVLLGSDILPVGVLPATAVVTRAQAGPILTVRIRHLDGSAEIVPPERLAEFVTEAGNPGNRRRVAVADVFTPALRDWPGIRLADTPGLGSVFAHNTRTTTDWLPNVAVALVAVSVERPFSDEDRRLLAEARQHARRVAVAVTKVDLLSEAERTEVTQFISRALPTDNGEAIPVLPFSTRMGRDRWIRQLADAVLVPLARDVAGERRQALVHKTVQLIRACRSYLEMGLRVAEQADADRDRLRAAVLDESVNAAVLRDELSLAERRVCGELRPAFKAALDPHRTLLANGLSEALAAEMPAWRGNLARQTERFETRMADYLAAELTPLARDLAPFGTKLQGRAEDRFRRIVEAFRDRLGRNVRDATGVTIAPATWEARQPRLAAVPVHVGRAFMTNWELLWWMLPMTLVGGIFRRHARNLVPWEVEKNLARLAGEWAAAVGAAVSDLRAQACVWVGAELNTLDRLLGQQPAEAAAFQESLDRLDQVAESKPA
jgi:GTP-binding protein EngB required for normal cell division